MTATTGTSATTPASVSAYSFGDGAPPAIWLGLGASRLATLGAGLLAAVSVLVLRLPATLAAVPIGLAWVGALLPLAGRPAIGWLPAVTGHVTGSITGRRRWCGPIPATILSGPWTPSKSPVARRLRLRLPAEFGKQVLLAEAAAGRDGGVCALLDVAAGTVTVLFDVAGVDRYPLLDPAEQDQLLVGWGETLTSLARDPDLLRVQLLDRTRPTPLQPAGGPGQPGPLDELAGLLTQMSAARDSLLAIQFSAAAFRGRQQRRVAGSRAVTAEADLAALTARCKHVAAAALATQLVLRPLPANQLVAVLTDLLTPSVHAFEVATGEGKTGAWGGLSRRCGWDHVRVQDSWHRAFAVSAWPATPVAGNWLAPLLLAAPAGVARTVAVHLQPLAAADAARAARSARTRAELDRADRFRFGLSATAQADRAADGSTDLDADLVAGHSALRLSAVLTVTGPDPTSVGEASRQLEQAAAAARLQIQPLHGQHHLGLAATLPLCRVRTGAAL